MASGMLKWHLVIRVGSVFGYYIQTSSAIVSVPLESNVRGLVSESSRVLPTFRGNNLDW